MYKNDAEDSGNIPMSKAMSKIHEIAEKLLSRTPELQQCNQ